MIENYVISFPDGQYLDKDGDYSSFFYCKIFDTFELAMDFALGNIEAGISFRIDKIFTPTVK